ncbi:MAG: hypothetical protein ACOYKM_14210 [Caulobacterales bacterium]|jgi:hypothetical protein
MTRNRLIFFVAWLVVVNVFVHWILSGDRLRPVTDDLVAYLQAKSAGSTVTLNSPGGFADPAFAAADVIERRRLTLRINKQCLSACADILLAAAHTVVLDEAVVGFHGNPAMFDAYRQSLGLGHTMHCTAAWGQRFEALYRRQGLNVEFWREMVRRMPDNVVEPMPNRELSPGCPRIGMRGPVAYWLPTSSQLRDLLRLNFTGTLCADDPICIRDRLPRLIGRGRLVVVGDALVQT